MKNTCGPILNGAILFLLHILPMDYYVKPLQTQFQGMFHLYNTVSPKTSDLIFYIRQGLNRLVLQPKFVIVQEDCVEELWLWAWEWSSLPSNSEVSPRHRSLSIQPLGIPVDLAKIIALLDILYQMWA